MSDYDFRPGGSLKLKGGVAEGGIVKKWVHLNIHGGPLMVHPQEEEIEEQGQI